MCMPVATVLQISAIHRCTSYDLLSMGKPQAELKFHSQQTPMYTVVVVVVLEVVLKLMT